MGNQNQNKPEQQRPMGNQSTSDNIMKPKGEIQPFKL
jgi:hypothetical protein